MKVKVRNYFVDLVVGDITEQDVDAIVNAANSGLRGGGGVDGAIHRAGGPSIMEELKQNYSGCPTGSAVVTGGGKLKARHVIHAVGPIYSGKPKDEKLLAAAYRTSLELALQNRCKSVAFPSISTGAYGYPIGEASAIAMKTVVEFLEKTGGIDMIRFVLFSEKDADVYKSSLRKLAEEAGYPIITKVADVH